VTRFLLTRLVLLLVGLLAASALIFFTIRVLPGDVAQVIAGTDATPEAVAAIRDRLGLGQPVLLQYLDWIGGLLRGDLGNSLVTGTPVASELAEKAQVTVPAVRRTRATGTIISFASQGLAAVPVVWAGMMLVLLFAVVLGWLPAQGFPRAGWNDPLAAIRSLLLPALTIGVVEGAVLLRFVRSAALDAIGQDYVRTAAAKGLTRSQALVRHGLPNVALSVVTVLGLQIAGLIVGSVIIEQLFTLPGIGRMLVADVGNRDLVKVQGELLVLTGVVLVIGAVVDVVHRLADPRLRERERAA
jgi:peptide/nickel transport system permease protein